MQGLLVKARLGSPLAGDPPMLDGLLSDEMCNLSDGYRRVDKRMPAFEMSDAVRIPIPYGRFGGQDIARASSPIFTAVAGTDRHEHIVKKLAVDHADLLAPDRRLKIVVSGGDFKSYRLPIRVRTVPVVAWFTVGERTRVLQVLKRVLAIGDERRIGYGRVLEWTIDRIDADLSWFAPTPHGTVLMRPLPADGDFPPDIIDARPDFAACQIPYWHPDRFMEAMVPC